MGKKKGAPAPKFKGAPKGAFGARGDTAWEFQPPGAFELLRREAIGNCIVMIDKGPISTLRRYLSGGPDALPNEKPRK